MSVPPIHLVPDSFAVATDAGLAPAPWSAGELVHGEIMASDGALTILRIDGLAVATDSPVPAVVPARFEAFVVSGGPRPVLEIIPDATRAQAPETALLRTRLAQQGGIAPLLADLHALADLPGIGGLAEPLRVALARLEASVANRDDLYDPDLIRDALQRSGVQLEYALADLAGDARATTPTSIEYDFKAALERLIAALPAPAPTAAAAAEQAAQPALRDLPLEPQARAAGLGADAGLPVVLAGMLAHAQAAHARIEVMQADAAAANPPYACMGEIPVRGRDGFDVLQVKIQPSGAGAEQVPPAAREWVLEFTFVPPELGTVQGQICLCGERVAVDLWAERERAVVALEDQADALLELMRVSGVAAPQVRVHSGLPARHTGFERRILDATV